LASGWPGQGCVGTVGRIWHLRLLVLLVALLLPAALSAMASADDPYEEYAVPFDGYRHPVSSWPQATNSEMISFTVYAEYADGEFEIEVASQPDLDPDGTLADANRIDAYTAPRDLRVPDDVFSVNTRLDAQWLATVGTYYWQAYRREAGTIVYWTPVQRIFITERPPPDPSSDPPLSRTPPPQPPQTTPPPTSPPVSGLDAKKLSRSSARASIKRAIRTQSGRSPRKLTTSCRLPTPYLARCELTWRDARYRYSAKARLTSTAAGIVAKIDGTRTKRSGKPKRTAIHWSVATAG
jgi:hypothetical protein